MHEAKDVNPCAAYKNYELWGRWLADRQPAVDAGFSIVSSLIAAPPLTFHFTQASQGLDSVANATSLFSSLLKESNLFMT